jgi:hypothetical protein
MRQEFHSEHRISYPYDGEKGRPAGGVTTGCGFRIEWQDGPLGSGSERKEPNGAFVESVIAAALDRLAFYQLSEFACIENTAAIMHLELALKALDERTKAREARGVEGTHEK